MNKPRKITRRRFVAAGSVSLLVGTVSNPALGKPPGLKNAVGIVTASTNSQHAGKAKGRNFTLLELPKILREELDMTVMDLNTSSFPQFARVSNAYLDKLRAAVEKAGCIMTNLKMNQPGIDMNSRDKNVREKALVEYKRSIDIASRLGCRWARPLPQKQKPNMPIHVASYQALCDHAAQKGVTMLVENFGWMQSDPNSVVKLVKAIGRNVAAGVDTGNWNGNEVRYAGLRKSFPLAATCDFKARQLGRNGEHPTYDLRKCFEIAYQAGFRGPWCLEHANKDTTVLFRELSWLRDRLREWTAEAEKK